MVLPVQELSELWVDKSLQMKLSLNEETWLSQDHGGSGKKLGHTARMADHWEVPQTPKTKGGAGLASNAHRFTT